MEAAIEGDLAGAQLAGARQDLDALGDLIPSAVVFVCGGRSRGRDGLVVEDEGVEGDDFGMRVEDVESELARDEAWDRSDDSVGLLLAEHFG